MVDKMQLATEHPEPAPDAKTLIATTQSAMGYVDQAKVGTIHDPHESS